MIVEEFYGLHRQEVLIKYLPKYKIGTVANEQPKIEIRAPGSLSKVPYGEISYWMGHRSAYFGDSHKNYQAALRKFYDEVVVPEAVASEDSGKHPTSELYQKMGQFGVWAGRVGPGPWLKMCVDAGVFTLPGGVNPEEFNYFHEMIAHQESNRFGCPSFSDALGAGLVIGLPPVFNFGTDELRAKVFFHIYITTKYKIKFLTIIILILLFLKNFHYFSVFFSNVTIYKGFHLIFFFYFLL